MNVWTTDPYSLKANTKWISMSMPYTDGLIVGQRMLMCICVWSTQCTDTHKIKLSYIWMKATHASQCSTNYKLKSVAVAHTLTHTHTFFLIIHSFVLYSIGIYISVLMSKYIHRTYINPSYLFRRAAIFCALRCWRCCNSCWLAIRIDRCVVVNKCSLKLPESYWWWGGT